MFTRKLLQVSKDLVEIMVNNKPVKCTVGMPLIDAIELAGIDIPRFCYHEKLNIAGNCRMCLVELERAPKPVASCSYPVMPNMKVFTDTPKVKLAREGVLEFILANHPLDCPICDQGGECDLQDQSMAFGNDKSRFSAHFNNSPLGGDKRAVEDKNLGPIVKTSMNRCIHCTRCVRFANDIAGAVELGTTGRGNDLQIGTYVEKTISSELSGNIVDLCPVGALTSKPYAFKARPWELNKTESIDVLDACGSFIRVDSRGQEVMRILPRLNEEINDEWIGDKTRHSCDALQVQRLTVPMTKSENGEFVPITWQQAFNIFRQQVEIAESNILGIVGQLSDCESMVALKDFIARKNGTTVLDLHLNQPASIANNAIRSNYVFNSTINKLDQNDFILIIGANPRTEAAVLNIRIRKAYLNGASVYLNGPKYDLNYGVNYLGDGLSKLESSLNNPDFISFFKASKSPAVIIGEGVAGSPSILKFVKTLKSINKSLISNVLATNIAYTGAYELGIPSPTPKTVPKLVYLLNADKTENIPKSAFVVYQGHHGDYGASIADLILPGAAYTEKSSTYVTTEGRVLRTTKAVNPPGVAREDWQILRALSEVCDVTLPYDNEAEIIGRLSEISPLFETLDTLPLHSLELDTVSKGKDSDLKNAYPQLITNYYQTDAISRNSKTMAECTSELLGSGHLKAEDKEYSINV